MTEPVTDATVPPAGGGTVVPSETEDQTDEFQERVNRILEMIAEDPAVANRVLVELYVTVAEFKLQLDVMQAEFAALGPKGIFKMMRGG